MGLRFYKPVTPGRRGASVSDFAEITDRKKRPEKELVVRYKIRVAATTRGRSQRSIAVVATSGCTE